MDIFLNIMTVFHAYQIKEKNLATDNSAICSPKCFAHSFFSLKMIEYISCRQCNKESKKSYDSNYYVFEIYIWEIIDYVKKQSFASFHKRLFETIYSVSSLLDECIPFCNCPNQFSKSRQIILKETPPYILFHLTWDISNLALVDLFKIFAMIPLVSRNNALFKLSKETKETLYELSSIIAYYNGHYVSCIKSSQTNKWLFADDMIIKEISNYTELMIYCVKNHYVPIALCFSISSYSNMEEHITEKSYNSFMKELNGDACSLKKSNELLMSMMSNITFASIGKKKSGLFNLTCSFFSENMSQIHSGTNKWICTNCNHINSDNNLIRCTNCKKMITIKESGIYNNQNLTGSSYTFSNNKDNDKQIKNINNYDLLSQSNWSGYNDSIIRQTEGGSMCQTQYYVSDVSSKKEEKESMPIKEIELNPKLAQKQIFSSSIHSMQQSSIIPNQTDELMKRSNDTNLYKSTIKSNVSSKK